MDKQRILRQIENLSRLAASGQTLMPGALDQLRGWANNPDPEIAAHASQAYAQIIQANPSLATSNTNLNAQDPYQQAETLNRMSPGQRNQAITGAQAEAERNAPHQHGYVFDPLERATSAFVDWLGRSGLPPVQAPATTPPAVGAQGQTGAAGSADLGGTPTPTVTPEAGTSQASIQVQPGRRYTPDLFTPAPLSPPVMQQTQTTAAPVGNQPAPQTTAAPIINHSPAYTPSFLGGPGVSPGGPPPPPPSGIPANAQKFQEDPQGAIQSYGGINQPAYGVGGVGGGPAGTTGGLPNPRGGPNAATGIPLASVDPNSWLNRVGSELYNPNFNITPGSDPTQGANLVLRSYLQANGLPAGMQNYLAPYAQSAQGILRLSNPGANLTPVQELNGFSSLIGGLQQPGRYLDPVPLYQNIFSPQFTPTANSPVAPLSPQDQIGAVSGAFQALQPLLPQDTYANLSDLLNQAILSWSDQMNQTGGQGPDLISYLQAIGADRWLG